jgi:hypothetical protein
MPDFATVSVQEATQGKFINEYVGYIQQLPPGQAGRLHLVENEKPATVRRRLTLAAHALGINLIIKRSGDDVYFWSDEREEEQPRRKRSYTRRSGRGTPGSLIPSDMLISEPEASDQGVAEEETTPLDQSFIEIE